MNSLRVLPVEPDNIPVILKNTDRWGLWTTGKKKPGGRYDKIPIHPVNGRNTNAHSAEAWRSLPEAVKLYKRGEISGRPVSGIFFDLPSNPEPIDHRDDGTPLYLIGLDFDDCVEPEDGEAVLSDEVSEIMTALSSPYWEISPSGTGARAFVMYPKPLKGGNKNHREMYSKGRFLTVTGHGSGDLLEVGPLLEQLEMEWFGKTEKQAPKQNMPAVKNVFANAVSGFELPSVVQEGERNQKMLAFIGSLRGKNVPEDVLALAARQANQDRFTPPLDDEELQSLIGRYADQAQPQETAVPASPGDWPDPKPVECGLPDVPPFDLNLLPNAFRPFVKDVAERMQCPADFIAAPLVVATAAALGNRIVIAPKARDVGWLVPTTLWGAVVARPGMMKSPAISLALRPLHLLENEMQEEHKDKLHEYEFEKLRYAAEKKRFEERLKKGEQLQAADMPSEPETPKPERLITNDSTTQKLGMLCASAPRGILNFRDELTGWMDGLDADGREQDRAFYLEAWNGLNSFQVDRVGRESDHIETLNILVLGGIQPGKLQNRIRSATRGGAGDDGLLQRFQLAVWPDHSNEWENHDRGPDLVAENVVMDVFRRIRDIDPVAIGATLPLGGKGPARLHFTDEAQQLFDKWRKKLEKALRTGDRHPATESHLAKYRSLIPALALLFHLIDGGTGPVTKRALGRAIKWQSYLWAHARRIYSSIKDSDDLAALSLANKIKAGKLSDGFTVRDVYRNGWTNLTSRQEAAEALTILTEHGWLRSSQIETSGRPTVGYDVNPKIHSTEVKQDLVSVTSVGGTHLFTSNSDVSSASTGGGHTDKTDKSPL